ncbi:phosphodiester glycosidase family protein [Pontibacter cellulosilyticus]|uniref:Phosphodiester glycosidase family protein n=1 Tax=Pontibacter cellulosilyticus TaxID=1720253 RepID=A0A923NCM2_9BACT|nr:phosphodiester glycosidase family protein [Pontibacter cellulosilyticus]MBC5994475.1 phosphodiester glycosidase family protein [Pontibacter cellulosilyticus]
MKRAKLSLLVFLYLLLGAYYSAAQAQKLNLNWEPRQDLNILLPASVRVFEANGKLSDGAKVRAVYATVYLKDPNLKLRAVGSNSVRQTTAEAYQQHQGILAINGGYFSATSSVSLLVADGETVAPGPQGKVTRGAFGLVNGKPEIVWPYAVGTENILYTYPTPNDATKGTPSATSSKGAQRWLANQAVGGGPVLVKAGKIRNTSLEEGFSGSHLARHPRTAIGYLNDSTILMMVVDGRQQASAGVTLDELAKMMHEVGCYEAVNLDGGGSSAMVAADEVVNIPVDKPEGNRYSLRKNASALVLSELVPRVQQEVLYFDTDSPNYSEHGLWKESNHANYYGKTPSRLASGGQKYNKAIYTLDEIERRRYQLASWWTVNSETNTDKAAFVLHHGSKTDTLYQNQASHSTSGKWNVFGDFILGPGDYLELIGSGKEGKIVADAVRLVAHNDSPKLPVRGDIRIGIISDLNSGLGSANYEWQVDSIMNRMPRIWQPDLVVCGGDMVAGMGIKDTATLTKMWAGFDKHIAQPLRQANIPFAFTLGNHDGPRSYPLEQKAAAAYWNSPGKTPNLQFVDRSHFPFYYSFVKDGVFIVSWEASSAEITQENLAWLEKQFSTPEAKNAKLRFVLGHMPLYSVAQERDSKGNVLENPEKLRALLEKYKVHTYISGHHHAYYPGRRGKIELVNAGAAGTGPRGWLTMDSAPQNTVTIMDIFLEQDSITYTTYDIKTKAAKDMEQLDENALPAAIFGVNGHLLRRDVKVTDSATGIVIPQAGSKGTGTLIAKAKGSKLSISGSYSNLEGKLTGISLYKGRNTEAGTLLQTYSVKSKSKRSGNISATFEINEDLPELLSVGALYLQLHTTKQTDSAIRVQLYPEHNQAPSAPAFTSHNSRNTYAVRNTEALYQIKWEKATDPDGDFVDYTYQLASDNQFKNIHWSKSTGRVNHLKMQEQDWYKLLAKAAEGVPVSFYHRVIASDGKHIAYSPTTAVKLMKSNEPLEDFMEVPAPKYVFAGKLENADGAGYGAQWDKYGKLWLANYAGSLVIKQPDGTNASFSPLKAVSINGETYTLNPVNGIGIDADGNILVGRNRHLLKINAATGEGMAVWEAPAGMRAITTPRVNSKGEIYAMSLFAEDQNYVLKQSTTNPTTLDLIRTIALPDRILARTFDMTPDGLTLYFPNPGSPMIQKYSSKDGITYKREEDITSTAAGCNALKISLDGSIYAAVRASGVVPSSFHFRDDKKKTMWTLPLPEVGGAEARGIGVSEDGKTLIFCSWDNGGGFYKYVLQE